MFFYLININQLIPALFLCSLQIELQFQFNHVMVTAHFFGSTHSCIYHRQALSLSHKNVLISVDVHLSDETQVFLCMSFCLKRTTYTEIVSLREAQTFFSIMICGISSTAHLMAFSNLSLEFAILVLRSLITYAMSCLGVP